MVRVTEELALSSDNVTLYHAADPLLGHLPLLLFHGPSTTANYTLNSSRVQVHVFTPAGFQSFPRITISPNSPFYGVVHHLPREFQGDEVYRALAFALFKYFTELPDGVKTYLKNLYPTRGRRPGSAPTLFSEQHAAEIVKDMVQSDHAADIIETLQDALQTQHISNVDLDLVLPPGGIVPLQAADLEDVPDDEDDILDPTLRQYGGYTPLIKLFGEPVFLPTSRLRRAPSKPTALNRSKSFLKDQKVELRMKLTELVETEERYVGKVRELVKHVAADFRESAQARAPGSLSPSEEELEKLFPSSADGILQVNSAFMEEMRRIIDDTEEEALKDMETPTMSFMGSKLGRTRDPSGALQIARLFLEWFPKFTECYQDYIKASQHFPTLLNSFLDQQSSFKQRVAQAGEQTIRSILIEPVQRLPRYSLLIDQIVGCIPMTHPALQPMLKARDIITNICSMDDPLPDKPHVANRLRNMVEAWPLNLEPQGRLIAAADFTELAPPFQPLLNQSDRSGIFLLFSDCVVILKKMSGNMTGRELLREIEKPSAAGLLISMTNAAGGPAAYEFVFTGWHDIADVRFTEAVDGTLFWMTSTSEMRGAHPGEHRISKAVTSRCFLLQEMYEARAAKWGEDVVKARVEARFSEKEREDPTWTLRSARMPDSNLGLHAAIFQEGADQLIEGRKEPAPIRVVVDHDRGTKGAPVGHYGVEIVVNVTTNDMKKVSMLTVGLNGRQFQDEVALEDFLPTMSRRVIQLLSTQHSISNMQLTAPLVSYYSKTLHGLLLNTRAEKTKSFLASSPVKLLSSFWGGSSVHISDTASLGSKHKQVPSIHRNNSQASVVSSIRGGKDSVSQEETRTENPLVRLEQTFTGYVAALQSRKGLIIGRTLLQRSVVDELSVNELYNRLIESPFDVDAAADLGTEVIFVAFEKFLRIAWTDQIGPVMSMHSLDTLQARVNKRVPGDFADFVNFLFGDMAPQNRRAFTALIKLLANLLDGCGNDGDRGALTLAFAELLVYDGTAPNYINLLDRLVEDCDRIFEEPGLNHSFNLDNSTYESINSAIRGKGYTPSLASNTSSLRRKFGFDNLLRQNSRDERPSVWRQLSRSRSIDDNTLPKKLSRRPGSKDRPPIAGAFDEMQRPGSSHRLLETIGEPETEKPLPRSPRRKRRSSLSDLKSLMAATTLDDDAESPQPLQDAKETSEKVNASPKATSPSRIPVSPGVATLRGSKQKENVPDPFQQIMSPNTLAPSPMELSEEPTRRTSPAKGHRHSRTLSSTNIPTLRPYRSAPPGSESPPRPSSSPTRRGTQKLRLQSPQKLRERLNTEKQAVDDVDASLRSELSKIGEEMARVNNTRPPGSQSVDMRRVSAAVRELEDRIPTAIQELQDKQNAIQRDMETTVKAAEAKVRAIDQLYKEAVAENELLYEKFNGELGKIVKALKGKGKDEKEELMMRLRDQSDETARMKKENARLKREMVSLRAALKGTTE
ncbi:Rho guanyl nucleotide exchange factor [Fusarium subglutinans]|uniref:Rho guanyl nucleotide exchange factor n=1 Tax=Gibberella subglutinans TaxID=42677 RepID=A0A8H5LD26_GIBSU|nr:Rho guanyl nucleotide exchange factor [Fusarium subglutinans]KAF5588446.1 Rho guanyl nucleotide exchange factor [Fusarium subglutinans]